MQCSVHVLTSKPFLLATTFVCFHYACHIQACPSMHLTVLHQIGSVLIFSSALQCILIWPHLLTGSVCEITISQLLPTALGLNSVNNVLNDLLTGFSGVKKLASKLYVVAPIALSAERKRSSYIVNVPIRFHSFDVGCPFLNTATKSGNSSNISQHF